MQNIRAYDIDDRSNRLREMSAGADNVLRLALSEPRRNAPSDEIIRRAGHSAVELINLAADSVKANEARAEALMQKAIDQLTSAEARIRDLETRLAEAETRANEAESWVRRVHQVVLERFEDLRDEETAPRQRSGFAA